VSYVEEIRYRLLIEWLQQWVEKLSGKEPIEPGEAKELAVRLLAMALMLLTQHHVNKRGQCQNCGWSRWYWRFRIRRPQCTVCGAVDFAMKQELAVVWWRVFGSAGQQMSLEEVRRRVERGNA
jgi:hypothetical protein